jgi:spore germination protein
VEKNTPRQIVLLGVTYLINLTIVIMPGQLINSAHQHSYLSFLPAGAVVLIMLFVLTRSSLRFPGQDLFQSLSSRFPFIGRGIVTLYILFFFWVMVRDIRTMTDYTNIVLLPITPILIIALCITATAVYVARGGAKTIISITELYGPIVMVNLCIIPIIAVRDFDFGLMRPALFVNWRNVSEGSWYIVAYLGQLLILPFIFSGKDYKFKYGLYSMLISLGFLMILTVMPILVLGVEVSERATYPVYDLVRELRITDFLDRFDLILAAMWYPSTLLNIAISLYIVCYGLKTVIPSVSGKMMAAPVGLFAYSCAFWFYENSVQLALFNRVWTLIALLFIVVLPLLIFTIHRPAKA